MATPRDFNHQCIVVTTCREVLFDICRGTGYITKNKVKHTPISVGRIIERAG